MILEKNNLNLIVRNEINFRHQGESYQNLICLSQKTFSDQVKIFQKSLINMSLIITVAIEL